MSEWTPAPWRIGSGCWSNGRDQGGWIEAVDESVGTYYTDDNGQKVFRGTGKIVCQFTSGGAGREDQNYANASLIATAPELAGQHEDDLIEFRLLREQLGNGDMAGASLRIDAMQQRKELVLRKARGES